MKRVRQGECDDPNDLEVRGTRESGDRGTTTENGRRVPVNEVIPEPMKRKNRKTERSRVGTTKGSPTKVRD